MVTIGAIAFLIILTAIIAVPAGVKLVRAAHTIPRNSRNLPMTMREAVGAGGIPVQFTTEDGEMVPGWFKAGTEPAAVVLLHGLGGSRSQLSGIARHLNRQGWGILLIDQSGHGEHSREYTTFGRAESYDALAAVEWLRNRDGIDPDRIGLLGASMGAATTIYAASKDPRIACAVADSSFSEFEAQAYHDITTNRVSISVPRTLQPSLIKVFQTLSVSVIGEWASWPDPVDVVGDIKSPLFLIHGECDERIDPSSMDDLLRAARSAEVDVKSWKVDDEGHCDYHGSAEYLNRITEFFRENL